MKIENIAHTVRHCRNQMKLSQKELALIAGVGKTAVFDIEHGKSSVRFDTLLKVLEALNIHIIIKSPFREDT